MDIRKLQRVIVDGLEDVKAHDIHVYNTEHLSSEFERVIVASGTSNRQTRALAASVRDAVKAHGLPLLSVEGEANGEWIIVDCDAAVAHIMQPAIREYYNLEEIWGGKPVHMKLGAAPAIAKAGAKAVATTKSVARKSPAKTTAKTAGKAAATTAGKNAATTAGKKAGKKAAKKAGKKAVTKTVTKATKPAAKKAVKRAAKTPPPGKVAKRRKA
jgi:ribosome-associated protein